MTLPIKRFKDIKALGPQTKPETYLPRNWKGTALDILRMEVPDHIERICIVLRNDWLDEIDLRRFADICARRAAEVLTNPPACVPEALERSRIYLETGDWDELGRLIYNSGYALSVWWKEATNADPATSYASSALTALTSANAANAAFYAHGSAGLAIAFHNTGNARLGLNPSREEIDDWNEAMNKATIQAQKNLIAEFCTVLKEHHP